MKYSNHIYPLSLILLPWLVIFIVSDAAQADSCVTAQCHSALLKGKNIHPVADPCETCHEAALTPHPQKNKKTFKLVQDMPALCNQCHPPFSAKYVHSPVREGMCTSCHNPHSSNEPKLLSQAASELCTQCHSDKTSYPFAHGPAAVGDCVSCHSPHESRNPALTLHVGGDICFACHGDMQVLFKKKFVHTAMSGGCTSCHNPHGSKTKKFLSAAGDQLCYQCHPGIEEKTTKAKVIHQPIKSEKGCASCHSPHSSDQERLLPKVGQDLCFDCHKGIISKEETLLHGPIKGGRCTPCHDPHGSAHTKLLTKSFNPEFYIPYTDKEYELCFSCHKRDLLQYPTTSFATNFRDGERNLHYVHVNIKDKGRSCRACHRTHAGPNPKLIADKTSFGKWSLPLKFVKTESGGSCAPGCHRQFNYDRKSPGAAPAQQNPKTQEKGRTRK